MKGGNIQTKNLIVKYYTLPCGFKLDGCVVEEPFLKVVFTKGRT